MKLKDFNKYLNVISNECEINCESFSENTTGNVKILRFSLSQSLSFSFNTTSLSCVINNNVDKKKQELLSS